MNEESLSDKRIKNPYGKEGAYWEEDIKTKLKDFLDELKNLDLEGRGVAIQKINRYKLEVENLRKELDKKQHQIKDVLKEYDSIQSYKKGTNDKERIRLKELFNIKFVSGGVYGSGFFDGLKTASEHYNQHKAYKLNLIPY